MIFHILTLSSATSTKKMKIVGYDKLNVGEMTIVVKDKNAGYQALRPYVLCFRKLSATVSFITRTDWQRKLVHGKVTEFFVFKVYASIIWLE